MRIAEILISAVLGGAIGFAASQFAGQGAGGGDVEALVDARVSERLAALGLEGGDLDGRISGGVAQFLADQPEAVMTALERHQENVQTREEEARRNAVANLGDALTGQPGDPAIGAAAADADVTLVEFFDYRCGYCKRALAGVLALADTDPKLRVVLKEFPILGPESIAASQVSLAAHQIDPVKYRGLHEALMHHTGGYDKTSLLGVAAEAGYDPVEIERAIAGDAVSAQIRNAFEIAEALGIRGTPAFVIGDIVIPGAVGKDRLRTAIETVRAQNKG